MEIEENGGFDDEGDFDEAENQQRMVLDKATGEYVPEEYGEKEKPEDDFFGVEEAGDGE